MDQAIVCHDGFIALYVSEVDSVYAFFARRVSPSAAEELTAETFAAAFASLDHHDPALGTHPAWVMGIALNVLRHHYRSERRRLGAVGRLWGHTARQADDEPGLDEDAVLGRIVASDDWRGVVEELDGLPPVDRDTLLLYAVGGLSYAEIAAVLGVPVGTVRSRINRARARLDLALDRTALRTADVG
ncbi:MAG TPA: RNA polymerase sigma factor [Iamia sp.]